MAPESLLDAPVEPRLLLVDDEDMVLSLLGKVLENEGYVATTARTLGEARKSVARSLPDVILVDKNLPDGSGLELCRELAGADCELVLMSGFANVRSAVEALQYER